MTTPAVFVFHLTVHEISTEALWHDFCYFQYLVMIILVQNQGGQIIKFWYNEPRHFV